MAGPKQHLGEHSFSSLMAHGSLIQHHDPSRVVAYGHSLLGGINVDPDRDAMTHLCALLGAQEKNRAQGGAVLHWDQQGAGGDGGFATVLQMEHRPVRVHTTLNATANAGVNTISVASRTGFRTGDLIFVGIGDAGASGGEMLWNLTNGQTGAGNLTVQTRAGGATARAHQSGEPVYVVPAEYINQTPLYLLWYGLNDIAQSPITAAATANLGKQQRWTDPLELVLARMRCAEVFEETHSSCVYTGTWNGGGTENSTKANSGTTIKRATVVNDKVTIHVPDNFNGRPIVLGFTAAATSVDQVWTFTVDGVAHGTKTLRAGRNYTARTTGWCYRIEGLAAGRHKIEAQVTTLGTSLSYFDWWGIESIQPPVILCIGQNRPYAYSLWPSANNRRQATQINNGAGYAIGTTVFTVDAMAVAPEAGATVTFEEGLGNSETLEVSSATTTSITTTSASTKAHADNSSVVVGIQDADIAKLDAISQTVIDTFEEPDGTNAVILVPIDDLINKNLDYFYYDLAHFVDKGYSLLTERIYSYLMKSPIFTSEQLAYTAVPVAPVQSGIDFAGQSGTTPGTAPQWANMPAGIQDLFNRIHYRHVVDLRRTEYWRLLVGVQVAGSNGAGLRLQYSLDGGVTFKYFGRSALFAEDGTVGEALITSTGLKDSGWVRIPTEAQIDNLTIRVAGINGNSTADPQFDMIRVDWRG